MVDFASMKTLIEQTDRMTHALTAAYGSWQSPITADLIVASTISLIGTAMVGDETYWLEMRPAEEGRSVLVKQDPSGRCVEVNAAPLSMRNRVHEYGGGSFVVHRGQVLFSNNADQRLYCLDEGGVPRVLTPAAEAEGSAFRYADGTVDARGDRWIGIRETHRGDAEPRNEIVAVSLSEGLSAELNAGEVLVAGDDFYAAPRLSPDGRQLTWLSWNHPAMPWDSTTLWVAELLADGSLGQPVAVAGGPAESIVQPTWSPDGRLYFVSDRSDWWNLYRWDGKTVEAVCPMAAEFGLPQWVFCMDTYAFASAERIVCTYSQQGIWHLGLVDTVTGELETITSPYTEISDIQANGDRAIFIAGSAISPTAVVQLNLKTRQMTVLRSSSSLEIDPDYLAEPELVSFPTTGLAADGCPELAHGIYYPPKNRDYVGLVGERPPLLVKSHGGPTAAARSSLNLGIQYWTSRGFAVLDVNYRGSTGYGRPYRERLKGQWGIVDVDDCVAGAKFLTARGDVDGDRLAIDGGSAGGYTTLCALTFHKVFKAGASRYGVSDLTALAEDTHKFEARYLDSLVGPYPASKEIYAQRSPIHHVAHLSCPVIFFQGLEDKVVPPNQAESMVAVLRAKGLPVAYVPFAGEQHGFRKAENIKRTLECELYFYAQVFGFQVADAIEPVEIANLTLQHH